MPARTVRTFAGFRDDDTNFFTHPDELIYAYGDIWDKCPVTLAVVPFIKGNWKYWVHEIEKNSGAIDWEQWEKDDQVFPLHENTALVSFLKEKIRQNKIDIAIHGIHHRNEDTNTPVIRDNYARLAEFVTRKDLSSQLHAAIKYLENTLETNVSVFIAPQNIFSSKGLKAVDKNNLNIVRNTYAPISHPLSFKTLNELKKFAWFKLRNRHKPYPFILNFNSHREVTHFWLKLSTEQEELRQNFNFIRQKHGIFVLSSHYYALQQVAGNGATMKGNLLNLVDHINQFPDVDYQSVSKIFQLS